MSAGALLFAPLRCAFVTDTPTPLTLVISPEFGAPHLHPDGSVRYHIDRNLAGRIIAFKPELPGLPPRSMFEIGRHPSCWLRIDRTPELNTQGYSVLNAFSRVHVTFQWMDVERYHWVGESRWFVIPGGVFLGRDGIKESSGAKNGVYLNGARLADGGNPEPLFQCGTVEAYLSLGLYGRMIVVDGLLDDHSTGWDRSRWEGRFWPVPEVDHRDDTGQHERRLQVEGEVVAEKAALQPRTGHTLADVALFILTGPPEVNRWLWWGLCSAVGLAVVWLWER